MAAANAWNAIGNDPGIAGIPEAKGFLAEAAGDLCTASHCREVADGAPDAHAQRLPAYAKNLAHDERQTERLAPGARPLEQAAVLPAKKHRNRRMRACSQVRNLALTRSSFYDIGFVDRG